jgi:broad specificity phosphatase PhoE
VLVRHARPEVQRDIPRAAWRLSESGEEQAIAISSAPYWDGLVAVLAGDERRMVETVQPLASAAGVRVETSSAFRESHSAGWIDAEQLAKTITAFFASPGDPPAPGWESAHAAATRFLAGIDQVLERRVRYGTVAA